MQSRLIEYKRLREIGVSHGKVQIWRLVKAGKFPAPIKIGARSAWIASEIDAWIAAQIARPGKVEAL
jgi:prophage regulatory protein